MERFGPLTIHKDRKKSNEENTSGRLERDRTTDIEHAVFFLERATRDGKVFSERIPLTKDNEIDRASFAQNSNSGQTLLHRARTIPPTLDGFGTFLEDISAKNPHIDFSFEAKDGWLTVSATNDIRVGTWAQWVSSGADQWKEPQQITAISEDGTHVFFDGSNTGVPVEQLEVYK